MKEETKRLMVARNGAIGTLVAPVPVDKWMKVRLGMERKKSF